MFRVCPHTLAASKIKNAFNEFIYKPNCRGNVEVVFNAVNSWEEPDPGKRKSK